MRPLSVCGAFLATAAGETPANEHARSCRPPLSADAAYKFPPVSVSCPHLSCAACELPAGRPAPLPAERGLLAESVELVGVSHREDPVDPPVLEGEADHGVDRAVEQHA